MARLEKRIKLVESLDSTTLSYIGIVILTHLKNCHYDGPCCGRAGIGVQGVVDYSESRKVNEINYDYLSVEYFFKIYFSDTGLDVLIDIQGVYKWN